MRLESPPRPPGPLPGHIRCGDLTVNSTKVHVAPEPRQVSKIFQDSALWPHISTFDHVSCSLHKPGVTKKQRRHVVGEIPERVGVSDFAMRCPSTSLGGQ